MGLIPTVLLALQSRSQPALPSDLQAVAIQWANPTDVLTVLMIIGGDIVQRALASMAGSRSGIPFVPVAYSFGWVSYSFSAILAAVGECRLLPGPDYECLVISPRRKYNSQNRSYLLGRLLRDHEVREEGCPLVVEFFNTIPSTRAGQPEADWLYIFSVFVIISQLILSIVPIIIHQHYTIFILTLGGTILALLTAALPQWEREKWTARETSRSRRSVVCLTSGNFALPYVMVIVSDPGCGLQIEDLAAGGPQPSAWTSVAVIAFAVLWFVHLITAQGLTTGPWFFLAIGALGMIQNAIAAGAKRSCGALGFHLERKHLIRARKIFTVLQIAEEREPFVGLSLLPIYFPGGLLPEEIAWRNDRMAQLAQAGDPPSDMKQAILYETGR
ncbi:hypothetical protein EIP86_008181 [Pleurotus ostreatoroseus]|nr:hypothetical protein EIP86_008181 [Pleurotus ostreatoroseus]